MKFKSLQLIILIIGLIILTSCAKEMFGTKKKPSSHQASAVNTYTSAQICSQHSVIKPKVDFLFLWDNSTSQTYVDPALQNSFSNLINRISSDFDHHILMAPLIGTGDTNTFLTTYNHDGLSSSAINRWVPNEQAADKLNQIVATGTGGNSENGFYRAYQLINSNRTNGIFRSNAYINIVVMSNGDVRTYNNGYWIHPYNLTTDKTRLLNLRNSLNSEQMRFMTLVTHNNPPPSGYRTGYAYKDMSAQIYYDPGHRTRPSDQNGNSTPDSYNIIGADYNRIFDGINQSISMVTIAHHYNYWPIVIDGNYDPNTLKVTKYNTSGNYNLTPNDTSNGFVYSEYRLNQNTRYSPTPGEPYTGYMVQLFGNGRVRHPDCVVISADEQSKYYGYFTLSGKPVASSISCKKNGSAVSQSSTNGWEYINYKTNQNVLINSPGHPAEYQTGYMLKLNGSAVYTNSETFNCLFDPSS